MSFERRCIFACCRAGSNEYGQLGNGSPTSSSAPVAVAGSHNFRSIYCGSHHNCALDEEGRAWCWGEQGNGASPWGGAWGGLAVHGFLWLLDQITYLHFGKVQCSFGSKATVLQCLQALPSTGCNCVGLQPEPKPAVTQMCP